MHTANRAVQIITSLGLFALAASAAGCSDSASEHPAASVELLPSSIVIGAYATPLESLQYPDDVQTRAINAAGNASISECMKAQGFKYTPIDFAGLPDPSEAQYLYGFVTMRSAEQSGYRGSVGDSTGDTPRPVIDDQYTVALLGDDQSSVPIKDDSGQVISRYDPSSCSGKAYDDIMPGWANQQTVSDTINGMVRAALTAAKESPEVASAVREWSSCMLKRGHKFASPDAASGSLWPGESPSADEFATAKADIECQQEVNYLKVLSSQLAIQEQVLIDRNPGIITQWKANHDAAVTAAAKTGF